MSKLEEICIGKNLGYRKNKEIAAAEGKVFKNGW